MYHLVTAHSQAIVPFVAFLAGIDKRRPNLLRVLMYHRVAEPDTHPTLYPGLISATPEAFDQQMSYLAANYNVVSMREVLDACLTGAALPHRSVLITFDDGYCDFAENAWPTLKRYGLLATLFVATAFPDHPERTFWWDRLYLAVHSTTRRDQIETPIGRLPLTTPGQRAQAFDRLKEYLKTLPHHRAMALVEQIVAELGTCNAEHSVLDWSRLRQLASEGVTLGAHTRTHPMMPCISAEEVRSEAIGSLHDLEREVGPTLPIFAYPSGGFNDEVTHILEREGFVLAFTTVRGINDLRNADRLRLRRIGIGQRTTLPIFRAQLLSSSRYLNRWWSHGHA